jgi:hypothetical protein
MIDDDDRLDEEEFWTAFNNLHPRLLGALLDAVSGALRELPNTHGKWPRMADFARRAIAAEKGMGRDDSSDIRFGNFIDRYRANIEGANETALTTSIIGLPVVDLMSTRSSWEGTASQLLVKLTAVIDESARQQKDWKSLKGSEVGKQLRRLTPNLRKAGIKITHRVGKSRMIRLEAS